MEYQHCFPKLSIEKISIVFASLPAGTMRTSSYKRSTEFRSARCNSPPASIFKNRVWIHYHRRYRWLIWSQCDLSQFVIFFELHAQLIQDDCIIEKWNTLPHLSMWRWFHTSDPQSPTEKWPAKPDRTKIRRRTFSERLHKLMRDALRTASALSISLFLNLSREIKYCSICSSISYDDRCGRLIAFGIGPS